LLTRSFVIKAHLICRNGRGIAIEALCANFSWFAIQATEQFNLLEVFERFVNCLDNVNSAYFLSEFSDKSMWNVLAENAQLMDFKRMGISDDQESHSEDSRWRLCKVNNGYSVQLISDRLVHRFAKLTRN
jgi:hypothetical protein